MTIELEVEGTRYTQFVSASVSIRLDALSNTFNFQAASADGRPLPFTGGESCRIIVDGENALTGTIEIVEVSTSSNSHDILISGRDKTGDLLDSTLDSISDLSAPITLKQVIETVISELGLDIEVIDMANPKAFNQAEDILAPEPGQNAFDFLEQYSRKRQVLLTSNGDGNIVITQSQGTFVNAPLRHQVNGESNNIISSDVSYDTTGRFNIYKFVSSLNPTALNFAGTVPLSDVVSQEGDITDPQIRAGRQLILVAEEGFSNEQNRARAEWEANIRKARGRVYSARVNNFKNVTNALWGINTLISIIDDFAGIDARMLVNTVVFNFDLTTGSTTTLGFVNENAYTLTLEEPRVEKVGGGLFG